MKLVKQMLDVVRFQGLETERNRIVFYSEGKNYWPYLRGLIRSVIDICELEICYVSSDSEDPGLRIESEKVKSFFIGSGFMRDWFFANIKSGVIVMTMPDLNQFQIKRSTSASVHYVYIQHSLVSMHMIYREGAFDYFDTIFCSGPHHVKEIRAMEQLAGTPPKKIIECGYPLLDEMSETLLRDGDKNTDRAEDIDYQKHILVAPTWGESAIIESGIGEVLVSKLLANNYRVTLRPHPETIKHSKGRVNAIVFKHSANALFSYEENIVTQTSLYESDIMLCDWSGVALEYAFGLNKPVIFIDTPRKINNPNYKNIDIEPFEISIRNKIGVVATIDNILEKIVLAKFDRSAVTHYIFNLGSSATIGAQALIELASTQVGTIKR